MTMILSWKTVTLFGVWYLTFVDGSTMSGFHECQSNEYQVHIREGPMCCKRCPQSNHQQPCPNVDNLREECRCDEGYACTSASCVSCIQLPKCTKEQQLKRKGNRYTAYDYICEKCPEGTLSLQENGLCKPVVNPVTPTENITNQNFSVPDKTLNSSETLFNSHSIMIYSVFIVFILLLITIFIHLLIWKMKTAKSSKPAEIPFPPQMIITMNPKEDTDSWSCQYPEEEHGDVTTEKIVC